MKTNAVKKCTVVYNKEIGSGFYHMKLETKSIIKAKPAQFINVKVSDTYQPLLRRPFSVFNASGKSVEIVYKVLGEGTVLMSKMQKGHKTDFIGPQGNSYLDFLSVDANRKPQTVNLFLIGGGTGIASLHYLALQLKKLNVKFTMIQGAQ
jgi:dihydroorotate dehydrogenase electron transfer subunit